MANDLLNPPEAETASPNASQNGGFSRPPLDTRHELDSFTGDAFKEKPIWAELFENVHDLFFPPKLPPLELTSKPIPVVDPMAVKRNPASFAISLGINLAVMVLLLWGFRKQLNSVLPPKLQLTDAELNIKPYVPTTPKSGKMGGGGGGGNHEITPPNKGHLPKIEKNPIVPPTPLRVDKPKIAMESAINVQTNIKLPDNPNLPMIGVSQSPNVSLASTGPGSGAGMGTGKNGGLGSGTGNGYGPGTGGNVGGGLYRVGDGVSAPRAIFQPEAEFSDEARRAKYEGTVIVSLIVDAQGNPQNVHIVRALGMGLDEKALEAVRQYKFKPAMERASGKAVPVPIQVVVSFRLY
jgi:TonB family protein